MSRIWNIVFGVVAVVALIYAMPTIMALFGRGSSTTIEVARPDTQAAGADAAEETVSYELVTLLPKNGIPAINNPEFVEGAEADAQYQPHEVVIGVEIDGDARAYSVPFLSGHEIVNDVVGGQPVAVTW